MLFNDGMYKHESGFMVYVNGKIIMLTPDAPMSMRIDEFFNSDKWTDVSHEESISVQDSEQAKVIKTAKAATAKKVSD